VYDSTHDIEHEHKPKHISTNLPIYISPQIPPEWGNKMELVNDKIGAFGVPPFRGTKRARKARNL